MRDPLVVPAAAVAAGILIFRFVPFARLELACAFAAFFVLGIVAMRWGSRILAGACCCLGFVCAGCLAALVHVPGPAPELNVEGREIAILAGCVVEPPAVSGERERFVLELEPGARAQVTLYTRSGETLPALSYGQRIEMDARIRKPRNFGNPGAFDYERYLARQNVYWTASGAAGTLRVLGGTCGSAFQRFAMNLRSAALGRIERLYPGNPYNVGMMQAILFGQSYQLQRIWTEDYRSTGTFHALVISGTHVAVLAAFFLFLLRICFIPEGAALVATAVAAWLYALVTGWQTPCVRSAAGLSLFIIGGWFYRERRVMNLLAAVALGFLVLDPDQLFDASFQLTFLAVGFLAVFAVPLLRATSAPLGKGLRDLGDTGRDPRLPPRVAQFRVELRLLAETLHRVFRAPLPVARVAVAVPARLIFFVYEVVVSSAAVQIGLTLPMAVYFHRVGISGLSANAVVVPLLSIVIPAGFVAVCTGWTGAAQFAGALLWMSRQVVQWHANLEPQWRIPTPPLWLGVAVSAALIAIALARGRLRIAAGAIAAALLTLVLWSPFPADQRPGELEMTAIDVGQGDSIFLALPGGGRVLVDGGGIPSLGGMQRSRMEIGEDVVAPYLLGRGIRSLDVIVSTHAHEDHSGGLAALIADFHPRELWTGVMPESPAWKAVREAAQRNGVRIIPMLAPRHFELSGAQFEILAPLPGYVPSKAPANNDSLVMRVSYGRRAFLLTGDIERQIEAQLIDDPASLRADALKVPHHGSQTSSTEAFLDAVGPQFAMISAGFENSYGNPHKQTLARLQARGAMTMRTDLDGLITARTDGTRLFIETNRWANLAAGGGTSTQPAFEPW